MLQISQHLDAPVVTFQPWEISSTQQIATADVFPTDTLKYISSTTDHDTSSLWYTF